MRAIVLSNRRQMRQGQSLSEMALLVPFLVVLIMGSLQFGMLFYTSITVDTSAREGARVASLQPTKSHGFDAGGATCADAKISANPVCAAVWQNHGLLSGPFIVDVKSLIAETPATACATGGYVSTTVSYAAPVFVPFINALLSDSGNPSQRTVHDTIVMRVAPCALTSASGDS